jgi:hypothetical protein
VAHATVTEHELLGGSGVEYAVELISVFPAI